VYTALKHPQYTHNAQRRHAGTPVYTALLLAMARCALSSHQGPALARHMVSSSTEDRLMSADLFGERRAAGGVEAGQQQRQGSTR
jgi:hypothetical protein